MWWIGPAAESECSNGETQTVTEGIGPRILYNLRYRAINIVVIHYLVAGSATISQVKFYMDVIAGATTLPS